MVEQIVAALSVLALLVATLWVLRRKGVATLNLLPNRDLLPSRYRAAKQMQILERIALTAHHSLHLVRVQDQTILIGVSPSGCNRITRLRNSSAIEKGVSDGPAE